MMPDRTIPTLPRRQRGTPLAWAAVLLGLAFLAGRAGAQASVSFTAQCNATQVQVGAPIRYTLVLETNGTRAGAMPVIPNWGGLIQRGGPLMGNQIATQIVNNVQSVRNYQTFEYQLAAPKAGRYTIAPAQISFGGKTYATQAVTIEAGERQQANMPVQFQGETIVSAQTDDDDINRQLDGRLFLRVTASNKTPYVREPVVVTCQVYLYQLQPFSRYDFSPGEVQGGVIEALDSVNNGGPNRVSFQPAKVGDKQYLTATVYRAVLTPTKSGKLTLEGMGMKVALAVRRSGSDPFGMFDDPFFGGGIQAELPTAPLELDVKPLPTAGQPVNFTGTVGNYTIKADADHAAMTEDDLVTLHVTMEGKGNVELAYQPALPQGTDFQVVGQSAKPAVKSIADGTLGGSRTFELVLRPLRAGALQIPALHYPTFNPAAGRYVDLATQAIPLKVAPGKAPGPAAPAAPAAASPGGGQTQQPEELHWLHKTGRATRRRPEPLLESLTFWMLHLAAAGLVLGAWKRNRRLATQDPANVRRGKAWRGFERRLSLIRQQKENGNPQELAGQVNQAARTFIADRFNLSAEGLTRVDIERLLRGRAVPEARVQRLCDLLEQCEALRYAPVCSVNGEMDHWVHEIVTIFKESMHE